MNKFNKLSLVAAASVFLAAGPVLAEGYTNNNTGASSPTTSSGIQDNNATMNNGTMRNNNTGTSMPSAIEPQAGNAAASINPRSLGMSDIRAVQTNLRNQGYDVSVDGIWGAETANALNRFQRENNLSVSGSLDADTQSALNLNIGN